MRTLFLLNKVNYLHRAYVIAMSLALAMLAAPLAARADDVTPQLEEKIRLGLSFLAKSQNPDGSWDGGGPKAAMTALSLMSFLAAGHTPDSGKYGLNVRNGVDFLIKTCPPNGYYSVVDGSRMYGQGMITLALIEAYGVEPDAEKRKTLKGAIDKALKVILDAQDVAKPAAFVGGWRYEPTSNDSDLSLSGWNALAMRAAQGAGFDVPKDRVEKTVGFVLRCYNKDQKGFGYQPGAAVTHAMNGVGVLNLYLLDAADRPELKDAPKYFVDHPITEDTPYMYYCMYYATQGAYQAGETIWPAVWKNTQQRLLALQVPDGGWPQSRTAGEPGRIYATSLSLLSLTVPYRLLPIYQR